MIGEQSDLSWTGVFGNQTHFGLAEKPALSSYSITGVSTHMDTFNESYWNTGNHLAKCSCIKIVASIKS